MDQKILFALLVKRVEERLASLPDASYRRGPRGQRGRDGRDGKDFVFSDHEETIRAWAKEFALKFEDFTQEQINALRGPRGRDGVDGRDGKDFVFSDHEETIRAWAKEFALKFEDLSAEDIEKLRGPRGRDGRDGKDGKDFELTDEVSERIHSICREVVSGISDSLKLKFEDLSAEDIEKLRGPRGRDGRDGRGFEFEEHREFFESLKPKFSDFTPEEVDKLRLHFSDLTEEEKATLKLRFSDLTDEEVISLRGARGPRGQRGRDGKDGTNGRDGKDGAPGKSAVGRNGRDGKDGRDGRDGEDAPYITDIRVESGARSDEIEFIFEFSDGSTTTSNSVRLPKPVTYYAARGGGNAGGGGDSSSGTPGQDGASAYEIAVENGFVGTEVEWLASLEGADGTNGVDGTDGVDGADGDSAYQVAVNNGFVGTEAEWLDSLVGPQGPPGPGGGGAESFSSLALAGDTTAVDTVGYDTFGAIEYSIALKMGTIRSFLKLVVLKSEGDFVDEWIEWDDIPDMDGPGATVETMWESTVSLDLELEANLYDDGLRLLFKNNEGSNIQVSGTRVRIPDFV